MKYDISVNFSEFCNVQGFAGVLYCLEALFSSRGF